MTKPEVHICVCVDVRMLSHQCVCIYSLEHTGVTRLPCRDISVRGLAADISVWFRSLGNNHHTNHLVKTQHWQSYFCLNIHLSTRLVRTWTDQHDLKCQIVFTLQCQVCAPSVQQYATCTQCTSSTSSEGCMLILHIACQAEPTAL